MFFIKKDTTEIIRHVFSISLDFPPKNSYLPSFLITAWSPPLPRATSIVEIALCNFSFFVPSSTTIAILRVTGILLLSDISFMESSISNFALVNTFIYFFSNIIKYLFLA